MGLLRASVWSWWGGLALGLALAGCGKGEGADPAAGAASSAMAAHHGAHAAAVGHHDAAAAASASPLDEVARVHGGAGPWAVAGYRMGQHALARLGLPRQSFDLDVTHRGPLEPQYACVADGASAATGASLGKVNLRLEEADVASVLTVYRRKSTGQTLALRPTEAFKQRFLNVPREGLRAAGEQVIGLRDDEIFEEAPLPSPAAGASAPPAAPSAPRPPAPAGKPSAAPPAAPVPSVRTWVG